MKRLPPLPSRARTAAAFTVMELLTVIAIMGVLAGLALPSLRGLNEGNEVEAAARNLNSDISLARAKAIGGRTTVAVVFIPPEIVTLKPAPSSAPREIDMIEQLKSGAYTRYAIFSFRDLGEQPGAATPRYLTEWLKLPNQTFIATNLFGAGDALVEPFPAPVKFPFPFEGSTNHFECPYVAFNHEGRLITLDGSGVGGGTYFSTNFVIPLARGNIHLSFDGTGVVSEVRAEEVPPNNSVDSYFRVVLNWLTGRGRIERKELQ